MKPIDIVIALLAVAIVVGVIVWSFIRKKQGKSIGCDCASFCGGKCGSCNSCPKCESEEKNS